MSGSSFNSLARIGLMAVGALVGGAPGAAIGTCWGGSLRSNDDVEMLEADAGQEKQDDDR